jgi:hypothetical protein
VAIESESQFEFRTDTVDTGDQNRVIGQVRKGKETAETTDTPQDGRSMGGLYSR